MYDQVTYLFLREGGGTAAEPIGPFLRHTFVRFHKVSKHVGLGRGDDAGINVGARTEIIENAG